MQHILVVGSISDGFYFVGPFESSIEATAYAEIETDNDWTWEILPLKSPTTVE